jgi:hypothetical protein
MHRRARARRLLAAAALAATTAATAVTATGGGPAAAASSAAASSSAAVTDYIEGPCPSIIVYGSRGSDQPGPGQDPKPGQPERHGLGLAIWEIYAALAATRPTGDVTYVANPYPAVDPLADLAHLENYVDSVNAGVAELQAAVPAIALECPAAKIAVIGYSQGADVTRRAVHGLSNPSGRIKVFQLADPHFDADEATVEYTGNYDPVWTGLARNLADLGVLTPAPAFRAEWNVESWCHGADIVCQYPAGTIDTHVNYHDLDAEAVAWRIAHWAGLGATTPIPVVHADGVRCSGSFPSRNQARFVLSAAGSPPGTSVTLQAVVDTSTNIPVVATLGPTGSVTWTTELPFGTRPRYQIYWGSELLLDQHMPPVC